MENEPSATFLTQLLYSDTQNALRNSLLKPSKAAAISQSVLKPGVCEPLNEQSQNRYSFDVITKSPNAAMRMYFIKGFSVIRMVTQPT